MAKTLKSKEILVRPEGIYLAELEQLSVEDIKNLRKSTKAKLTRLNQQIREINELETLLSQLRSDEISLWMREAEEKSQKMLTEYIGEEKYQELQNKGHITFKIGNTNYKLTKAGEIYRGRATRPLCLVRDRELPLPDHILSALVSLKARPSNYRYVRR